ncbi:radical SAM family heme chaperone HemW [Acidaminobacter sp. JC074]|uniref:radical SAM family heme chaperone HemW n=1 Tax=Acidaminobacter sp. JC074 TaxID=2530199 RepID=UPI001F0FE8FB|nr:radical SAM family heme chaperone HemW [Acidaminobacter sp. JC074]MCH4887739.1 radical SAM family heme chaperone HemW [Acidaminobacter sp. JC074]
MISLYIHIPFCVKKCGYCDFVSFEYDRDQLKSYLEDLKKEIVYYGGKKVHSIFIGGGTPSLLSGQEMIDLMALVYDHFDMSACQEISMESNPGTLTLENLLDYKKAGINRISMGVQTLNNDTLKTLDRIHDVGDVYHSVKLIKEAGFDNFNMDLMFGLPGQTREMLSKTVEKMVRLEPSHISAYSLKFEEGTAFYKKLEAGELTEIDDDLDRDMYHLIEKILLDHNYYQYEISNFSKVGFECKHNLVYWEKKDYIGLGLGAHSCLNNERFYNFSNFEDYHQSVSSRGHGVKGSDKIDPQEDLFEYIMLGLRLNKGLDIDALNKRYDLDFETRYKDEIHKLMAQALLEWSDKRLKLTSLGRDLSNQVFLQFLD